MPRRNIKHRMLYISVFSITPFHENKLLKLKNASSLRKLFPPLLIFNKSPSTVPTQSSFCRDAGKLGIRSRWVVHWRHWLEIRTCKFTWMEEQVAKGAINVCSASTYLQNAVVGPTIPEKWLTQPLPLAACITVHTCLYRQMFSTAELCSVGVCSRKTECLTSTEAQLEE